MTGRLAQICRHPIKGHGRETLASVRLLAGACLPWDRHWAVAHEAAQLEPGWNPCVNFARGAKAPELMAITSQLDEATATVTLRHPAQGEITLRPDDPADLPRFLDWVRPLNPQSRAQPARFVTAGRGMTDSDFPSVAILSTDAGPGMRGLHHREAVVLEPGDWPLWLGEAGHGAAVLMRASAAGVMQCHRVDPAVNSNRAEGAGLILPVAA